MNRYTIPQPMCRHKRKGIVTAGDAKTTAHAATKVCDRPGCIKDAIEWAEAFTREKAVYKPDSDKQDGQQKLV